MTLQTLPDVILLGIIQRAIPLKGYSIFGLKHRLYLLGIFQRLRAIALPKIYDTMYIDHCKTKRYKGEDYTDKYNKTFMGWIDTDADIIALANCTHMVKSVTILVSKLSKKCFELKRVFNVLQACASSWPNVTTLKISMNGDLPYAQRHILHSMELHNIDKKYSQQLAKFMPGITGLYVGDRYDCCNVSGFYSQIAGAYASQLVMLMNEFGFDHAGGHRFEAMKYLHIYMGHNNKLLPCVNSHTLVNLYIENISANVSWASFMNSKDDKVIEFPCLKKLSLKFCSFDATEQTDANMPELLLNFSELSSLDIVCHTEVCYFFNMARFPKEMENINIKAPPALLTHIKELGLPTAKKVILRS